MTLHHRIIFVNRFFYPDTSATSQLLSDVAFSLVDAGTPVTVVTSRNSHSTAERLPSQEIIHGVTVHRVWSTRLRGASLARRAIDYASFYCAVMFRLWKLADKRTVVVAKTDPPLLGVAAWLTVRVKGARLINWVQDLFPEVAEELGIVKGPLPSILRWLRNKSLRYAWKNVVIGQRMLCVLKRVGVRDDRICLISNWADEGAIRPVDRCANPLRAQWNVNDRFVVGYSGNFGRAHEFSAILEAAHLLQNQTSIAFVLIGDGTQLEQARKRAQEMGLGNVQFRPYQPRAQLSESLCVADVHLVSLRPRLEGLIVPSKFYGVLAAGRAVVFIGDEQGEIATAIHNADCGLTVPDLDAAALARTLRTLEGDVGRYKELGARARSAFELHYSKGLAVASWRKLILDALADDEESVSTAKHRSAQSKG